MTQKMANAKMRDYEPMSDETGYVPVDAVFSAPAPALEAATPTPAAAAPEAEGA